MQGERMTNVRKGWCAADNLKAREEQGWQLMANVPIAYPAENYTATVVFQKVLEGAIFGDPLCFKALRYTVKVNPQYKRYKPTVRAIYRKFHRGEK